MSIENIISLQNQIIEELERLRNDDKNKYLTSAFVQQRVSRNFAMAYQMEFVEKKNKTQPEKREYRRNYMRSYLPKYRSFHNQINIGAKI